MTGIFVIRRTRRLSWAAALLVVAGLTSASTLPGTAQADSSGTGGDYVAVAQAKVFDSRGTTGQLAAGQSVTVLVLGQGDIPSSGVGAVLVDITAVNPVGGGYIRVAPADGSVAATSSLSYDSGQTASNSVVVAPGSTGSLAVTNYSSATDVVVSIEGYFTAAGSSGASPGGFMPSSGVRVLDTRTGTGQSSAAPLSANHTATVAVAGQGDVPTDAAAAVVNITGLNATAAGYLTAWASGTTKPSTGAINYSTVGPISTEVTVPIGSDGNIDVQISNGSADVVIDVQGYFTADTTDGTGLTLGSGRLFDSRVSPNTSIPAGGTISVYVVPSGVSVIPAAEVVDVTAISPQASGGLRLWASDDDEPTTSQLNFTTAYPHSDMEIIQPGDDGRINIHNTSSGTVDVVIDLDGWFPQACAITGCDNDTTDGTGSGPAGTDQGDDPVEGTVVASADWGVNDDLSTYSSVSVGTQISPADTPASFTAGDTTPDNATPAARAHCHEEITDFHRPSHFEWETEQICDGPFGDQKLKTQMWRSSWSGPRGYGEWASTAWSEHTYIVYYWTIPCHNEHGWYTYYPVMVGWAAGIGEGPEVRTDNSIRHDCGTEPS